MRLNGWFVVGFALVGCTAAGPAPESTLIAELGSGAGCVLSDIELLAPDGNAGDKFGSTVAVDGDVAVIGAHEADPAGSASGAAYVFRKSGASWLFEQELNAFDGAPAKVFGIGVGVAGDVIVVGASQDNPGGVSNAGSGYVYRYKECNAAHSGFEWCFEQKLIALDAAAGDFLGTSVALFGTTAVLGAWGDDDNGPFSGSAYVFKYNGSSWSQQAKLKAADGAAEDAFGADVAISGTAIVIGASADDDHGQNSGSAYVFRSSGSTWSQEAKLSAADGAADDHFGVSVSISAERIAIGAHKDDDVAPDAGSVYVFVHPSNGPWTEQQKLAAADGGSIDFFGDAVAISGDRILIGASNVDVGFNSLTGAAYIFGFDGTAWDQQSKLVRPAGPVSDSHFGNAAAASGETFLVGAAEDYSRKGSAAIFMGPCAPGECSLNAHCADPNPCSANVCLNGTCGTWVEPYGTSCPGDTNPCTFDECQGGICVHGNRANGTGCNDTLYCDGADTCTAGTCVHSGNPCGSGNCNESNDSCGACTQTCTTSANCVNTNPCVVNTCVAGCCQTALTPPGTACTNNLYCDGAESCLNGSCQLHSGSPCALGEVCTESNDSCDGFMSCAEDLSGNGVVNSVDLAALLEAWGPASPSAPANLNDDSVINAADLNIMLDAWGACS